MKQETERKIKHLLKIIKSENNGHNAEVDNNANEIRVLINIEQRGL